MSDRLLPHIQILRGLSILLVFLFHVDLPWAGSGYLGVDIFFVISGFLMAYLYGNVSTPREALRFYAKRLWRLLPAYMVVLVIVSLVAAAFFSLPSDLDTLEGYGLWAAALMPNVGFWTDTSYFEDTTYRPFLHFWSLGVELQYYLIFPLVAWCWRRQPWLLVGIALLSFAGFAAANIVSQKSAFFLTPFRLWEFLAGFAAAAALNRTNGRWPWAGLAALLGLLAWMAIFPDTRHANTPHTAAVVILSTLVIALGLPAWVNDSFAGRALQRLGTYSYSLYLVHFPIIVFWSFKPFAGSRIDIEKPWEYAAMTVLTLALGIVLHHTVEQPFRRPRGLGILAWGLAACAASVLLTGIAFDAVKARLMPPLQYKIAKSVLDRSEWRCGKWAQIVDPFARSCRLTAATETGGHVLLVGNSHADAIKSEVSRVVAARGGSLWLMAKNYALGAGYGAEEVMAEAKHRHAEIIVLHTRWDSVRPRAIDALATLAAAQGIQLAIIDPVPNPRVHVPATLFAAAGASGVVPRTIGDIAGYEADNGPVLAAIDEVVRRHPNVRRYAVAPVFCTPDCRVIDDEGRPLYFDGHHLSLTGAAWLNQILAAATAPADPQNQAAVR